MKVMILDDEKELMEICCEAFEMLGHEAMGFTSAAKALESLRKISYDAVIVDSQMPDMTGEDFFKLATKTLTANTPPFFMATGKIDITEDDVKGLGMKGLVTKPFDIEDLVEYVKENI